MNSKKKSGSENRKIRAEKNAEVARVTQNISSFSSEHNGLYFVYLNFIEFNINNLEFEVEVRITCLFHLFEAEAKRKKVDTELASHLDSNVPYPSVDLDSESNNQIETTLEISSSSEFSCAAKNSLL